MTSHGLPPVESETGSRVHATGLTRLDAARTCVAITALHQLLSAKEDRCTVTELRPVPVLEHIAGDLVDLSLSVVLPVHNAQHTLGSDVHQLLEVLPDLTTRFEILIVDDASTDQTEEVAHELALQYPQLRVVRQQYRKGQAAAVQTAMKHTTGDVVFVPDQGAAIRPAELRQLWQMRHDRQLVMARAELPRRSLSPHLLDRLSSWGDQLRDTQHATQQGGIQMIRREAVEDLDQLNAGGRDVPVNHAWGPNFLAPTSNPASR